MPSVIKAWVFQQPLRMQAVLLAAIRGCDGKSKEDKSKVIVRALRNVLMVNADPTNSFMHEDLTLEQVAEFVEDLDQYPTHFVTHLSHAAEIVGFKHPDSSVRGRWLDLYRKMVKSLHYNPETEAQLDIRLGELPKEKDDAQTKKTAASVPAPVADEEATRIAISQRPLDMDDVPTKAIEFVPEDLGECECGHGFTSHYFFNQKEQDCQGGKCKCPSYRGKKKVQKTKKFLDSAALRDRSKPCICGHPEMMHRFNGNGGCATNRCPCREFRDSAEARITGDAGTGTSHRRPGYND